MIQRVCDVADVPPGASRRVEAADGLTLAVFNVDGQFYVLADTCSHGEASLSEGDIVGCEIVCPLHSGQFDLATGKATRRPAKRPQRTFPVDVVDGQILVFMDDEAKDSSADGLAQART
jgi:nitrite reductase/ring-hydroxylating ferredoxin subunit